MLFRSVDALADGDGVSALGDDAGEARDDEELECVADLLDVHADDSGDATDAVGSCVFGACVCAKFDWRLVLWVHSDCVCGLPVYVLQATRSFEDGEQTGRTGKPGVELPVQQSDLARGVLYGSVGNVVSCAERVCARNKDDRQCGVLQPG